MKIKTEVLFKLLKLVKKTGVLHDLKSAFKSVNVKSNEELEELQKEAGMDLFIKLVSNLDLAENEFYDLIAGIKEIDIDEARKMDLDETYEVLKAVFASEIFSTFLSSLGR